MFWNNIQSGSAPRDGFLRLLKVSCCIRNVLADNGSRICFFLNKLQKKKTGKKNIWAAGCLRLPSVIQTDRWNILFCNFQKCQPKKKKKKLHIRIQHLIRCLTDFCVSGMKNKATCCFFKNRVRGGKKSMRFNWETDWSQNYTKHTQN